MDLLGGLEAGKDGNLRDWVEDWMEEESAKRDDWKFPGQVETWCKGKLPQNYKDDPSKDS